MRIMLRPVERRCDRWFFSGRGYPVNQAKTKVVLAGGSGFLGRGLAQAFLSQGWEPVVLSRSAARPNDWPAVVRWRQWDARTLGDWAQELEGGGCRRQSRRSQRRLSQDAGEQAHHSRVARRLVPGAGRGDASGERAAARLNSVRHGSHRGRSDAAGHDLR